MFTEDEAVGLWKWPKAISFTFSVILLRGKVYVTGKLYFVQALAIFQTVQMENITLSVKKGKISIQMRRTFSKFGFMHYSMTQEQFERFQAVCRRSQVLMNATEGTRERDGGGGGGGGGGRGGEGDTHTRARQQTHRNLAMCFTVPI